MTLINNDDEDYSITSSDAEQRKQVDELNQNNDKNILKKIKIQTSNQTDEDLDDYELQEKYSNSESESQSKSSKCAQQEEDANDSNM